VLRPQLAALLKQYTDVRHLAIEDGPGQPLGRSFRVKLWPTFVFLRDGQVVKQLVRPSATELGEGFEALSGHGSESH
jgi:thioredoxin 1